MFPRIVCDDSVEDSRKSASCHAEVHGIPQDAAQNFAENLRSKSVEFVTNL